MPQICHAHCPPAPTGAPAVLIVAAAGGSGAAIWAFIGDIVLAAGITVSVLAVTGIWYLIHVLRRDRFVTHRAEIYSQAQAGEQRLLILDRGPAGELPAAPPAYIRGQLAERAAGASYRRRDR